jgi:hypothetical protein
MTRYTPLLSQRHASPQTLPGLGQGSEKAIDEVERGLGNRYDPTVAGPCLTLSSDRGFQIAGGE